MSEKVRTTQINWQALVDEADPDRKTKKPVAYRFSNGREFENPEEAGGVYTTEIP